MQEWLLVISNLADSREESVFTFLRQMGESASHELSHLAKHLPTLIKSK